MVSSLSGFVQLLPLAQSDVDEGCGALANRAEVESLLDISSGSRWTGTISR